MNNMHSIFTAYARFFFPIGLSDDTGVVTFLWFYILRQAEYCSLISNLMRHVEYCSLDGEFDAHAKFNYLSVHLQRLMCFYFLTT